MEKKHNDFQHNNNYSVEHVLVFYAQMFTCMCLAAHNNGKYSVRLVP